MTAHSAQRGSSSAPAPASTSSASAASSAFALRLADQPPAPRGGRRPAAGGAGKGADGGAGKAPQAEEEGHARVARRVAEVAELGVHGERWEEQRDPPSAREQLEPTCGLVEEEQRHLPRGRGVLGLHLVARPGTCAAAARGAGGAHFGPRDRLGVHALIEKLLHLDHHLRPKPRAQRRRRRGARAAAARRRTCVDVAGGSLR